MGFGRKWCFWIRTCVSSASYSSMVSETIVGFSKGQRGLRQGDLLFPFLLNIVMELLSQLVTRVEEVGCLSGYQVGSEGLLVTLLQFANDSLAFLPNSKEEGGNLRGILLMFEFISGL